MSHSIRRKSAVRSIPALIAAAKALGCTDSDIAVNGHVVTVNAKRFTGAFRWERPTPMVFDTDAGTVNFDADFTAQVMEFCAHVVAAQARERAKREGHTVKTREVTIKGRRTLLVTVEG